MLESINCIAIRKYEAVYKRWNVHKIKIYINMLMQCRTRHLKLASFIKNIALVLLILSRWVYTLYLYLRSNWSASGRLCVGCKFSITCRDRLLPSVLYREIRKERLLRVLLRIWMPHIRVIRATRSERAHPFFHISLLFEL